MNFNYPSLTLLCVSAIAFNNFAAQKEQKAESWRELVVRRTKEGYKRASDVFVECADDEKIDLLKQALAAGISVDAMSYLGTSPTPETALIVASRSGQLETVKFLLSQNADPDQQSKMGLTPLGTAIHQLCHGQRTKVINAYEDIVDALLEKKANPKIISRPWPTAIEFARGLPQLWPIFKKYGYDVQSPKCSHCQNK